MHTLAGEWKSSGETRRIKKKKIRKTPAILRLRSVTAEGNKLQGNPLTKTVKLGANPLAHGASSSVEKESQKLTESTWVRYLEILPHTSHYIEAVFSIVREIHGRQPGDPMQDLDVNLAISEMLMNTTLRAAVHLGKDHDMNLRFVKNHLWKTAGQLFR